MIRITQVKMPLTHTEEDLRIRAAKLLRIPDEKIKKLQIVRQSIDARKREEVSFSYVLDVEAEQEEKIVRRCKNDKVSLSKGFSYTFPEAGNKRLKHRPVIVGSGPAGLFCGLMLARNGYCPLILERGGMVEERKEKVEAFWKTGILDENCNVQFGEGGAGTFSDGKLNTLVKDPNGRNRLVLSLFAEFGADPSITYVHKPHIGTDVLMGIVRGMREEIIRLGGEVRFYSQVTDILFEDLLDEEEHGEEETIEAERGEEESIEAENGEVKSSEAEFKQVPRKVCGVVVNGREEIPTDVLIMAIGHSARDTFHLLHAHRVPMEAKAFAVGLRIQHPQEMIDESQYGQEAAKILGPASYKLTHTCVNGRGVYSFCMCPGGFVVNASSEEGHLAVNGMSYHARDGKNANSALIVTVTPEDFQGYGETGENSGCTETCEKVNLCEDAKDGNVLAGIAFQRALEERAYQAGRGKVPVQLYGDFKENRFSEAFGAVKPQVKGETAFANLQQVLLPPLVDALIEGIEKFGKIIPGFNREDAVLAGVESRTSSPVRILRDKQLESSVSGLFPCGEGAGYAGGITSAAMDGVRIAEEIARRYQPFKRESKR